MPAWRPPCSTRPPPPPAAAPVAAPPARIRLPDPDGSPPGTRLVWDAVDWDLYVTLADDPAHARFRFTYDEPTGRLEIEMPHGYLHEMASFLLGLFVATFARERGIRSRGVGSLTLRRCRRGGADGDEAFYISNFDRRPPRGTNLLTLGPDQVPPDLVVEVDVTSPGVPKLPIYARLGVPEVWVWADDAIVCRRLTGTVENGTGEYEITPDSVELPGFPLTLAADLIRESDDPRRRRPAGGVLDEPAASARVAEIMTSTFRASIAESSRPGRSGRRRGLVNESTRTAGRRRPT